MTNTLVGQRRTGRDGSIRKAGKRLLLEETYEFIVETDDKNADDKDILLNTTGVPIPGLTASDGGASLCVATRASRWPENPLYWTVTAEFSSDVQEDSSGSQSDPTGNPTTWVPIAELGSTTYQFYDIADIDGQPFRNSANYPFSSGIPIPRTLTTFEFEQFEPATTNASEIADRNETINEGPYIGMPARTLKLTVNSSTLGFYYGYRVWRVSYTLTHKKENWLYRVLDMGPFYIDNNQNPPEVPFKVGNPERLVSGFLTPQGGKSNVPTIKEFRTFEERNFGSFLRLE